MAYHKPEGVATLHQQEFHKEFLITTIVFLQTSFIKKKTSFTKIEIFKYFIVWQHVLLSTCHFISIVILRVTLLAPCGKLTEIAVNTTLGSNPSQQFQIVSGLLKLIITWSILDNVVNVARLVIRGIHFYLIISIIRIFTFGRKILIYVVQIRKK